MLLFFLYYSVVKSFFKDFFVFSFCTFRFLKQKHFVLRIILRYFTGYFLSGRIMCLSSKLGVV